MARTPVTHLRLHKNDLTWCYLKITGRPNLQVVQHSERYNELLAIRWIDGQIDRTPKTPEEKQEIDELWNATVSQVTCKRCTRNGKSFQVHPVRYANGSN